MFPVSFRPHAAALTCLLALAACSAGPDFVRPPTAAPDDWTRWHGDADPLHRDAGTDALPEGDWWRACHDPVLDELQHRAIDAGPDLQTAALHLAQARLQRRATQARQLPEVGASGGVTRQRQSESGASTRLLDLIGGDQTQALKQALSEPFDLYQAGVDLSWEPDLWGRLRRAVEAADADVEQQAALLDMTRLAISIDVATSYFDLRTAQRQAALLREDIRAMEERLEIIEARIVAGVIDHLDADRQRAELAATRARLPALMALESSRANELALLLGQQPGTLDELLHPRDADAWPALPDLALGLPSEVALRRPDIRAAEARLHAATAAIGLARADMYPSLRLGARFGHESYRAGDFGDWGSRTWSLGPVLDLPIFDHGRRRSVVQLRELQQQEAAIAFQRTVLKAWQEIDDALGQYASLQEQERHLQAREANAQDAWRLATAKYEAGTMDFLGVIDSQRSLIQARIDLAQNHGRLRAAFAAINKAIGNVPRGPE